MTEFSDDIASFGARLRAEGIAVDPARLADFAQALSIASMPHAYWVGRATLLSREADTAAYDRAFAAHFGAAEPPPEAEPPAEQERPAPSPVGAGQAEEIDEGEIAPASALELLRHKRFDECTDEELAQLAALIERIAWSLPPRRTRRRAGARHGDLNVQRTLRAAMRTGGETLELHRRERRWRPRHLVLLLDVSNSMAAYSRALLVFAHAALRAEARCEAFCFATRLTRVTDVLRRADPDHALRAAADAVVDWDGGTRIGPAVRSLLDGWGHTRVVRGAVVVICSDGLEVGEPDVLEAQMARLGRLAHEVVWLNPLKGLAGYEPLARGMRAALPHVDVFASGDNLASLEALARRFTELRPGRAPARRSAGPARG